MSVIPRPGSLLLGLLVLLGLLAALLPAPARADEDDIPGLIQALQDDNPTVRKRAAIALERLGPKAKEAIPALEKALKDSDEQVRAAAASALEKIDVADSGTKLSTPQEVYTLRGHNAATRAVAFSADGKRLA